MRREPFVRRRVLLSAFRRFPYRGKALRSVSCVGGDVKCGRGRCAAAPAAVARRGFVDFADSMDYDQLTTRVQQDREERRKVQKLKDEYKHGAPGADGAIVKPELAKPSADSDLAEKHGISFTTGVHRSEADPDEIKLLETVLPRKEIDSLPIEMQMRLAKWVEKAGPPRPVGERFETLPWKDLIDFRKRLLAILPAEERLWFAEQYTRSQKVANHSLERWGVQGEDLVRDGADDENRRAINEHFSDFQSREWSPEAGKATPQVFDSFLTMFLSHGSVTERITRSKYVLEVAERLGVRDELHKPLVDEISRLEASLAGED